MRDFTTHRQESVAASYARRGINPIDRVMTLEAALREIVGLAQSEEGCADAVVEIARRALGGSDGG
jgi:hypothetical protein